MTSSEKLSQQYRSLNLTSMAVYLETLLKQAHDNELSHLQFADMLVTHEITERNRNRVDSNRRKAGFPISKQLEEFDYRFQTTITKRQIN